MKNIDVTVIIQDRCALRKVVEQLFGSLCFRLGHAIGNPLFHWSHLELQRYFGYNGILNKNTADEVWNLCNEKLAQPAMSVRSLVSVSNRKSLSINAFILIPSFCRIAAFYVEISI